MLHSVNNKSGCSICRARNGKVINANLFKSKRRKKRYSPKKKNSASGSAKQGRDVATQAILPLRGKVINVERADIKKVMENEEIRSIINAIGAGFLDTFDISKMKYGKIVILTDKDFDGDHIRALLITFFFRYMPELVKAGRLYAGVPPLFRVIQGKNIHYCRTDKEKDEVLLDLKKKGISNYLVTRFKGLTITSPEKQQCFGKIHFYTGRSLGYQSVA